MERLLEVLPREAAAAADAVGDVATLVLEAPGAGARDAAAALERAGAFAHLDAVRLVVAGSDPAFAAACAAATGDARAILEELARALGAFRRPPTTLRLRGHELDISHRATVVGILNVTPDSFHDRGRYRELDAARRRAAEMVAEGAGIIDIGGQSYARGQRPVSEEEERARVVPVVEALVRDGLPVPLSIDTFRSGVAEAALAVGAHCINDCSGLSDERLPALVARHGAGLVVMHLKGALNVREPEAYRYGDAMAEILSYLRERIERALASGVSAASLIVDPGLEFGKEPATDLEILGRLGDLGSLGFPILLAASRKTFIAHVLGGATADLLAPSLAAAALGIAAGARLVRAHDVRETVQVARLLAAVRRGYA